MRNSTTLIPLNAVAANAGAVSVAGTNYALTVMRLR
jgi:hypothetical protein